MLRGVTSAALLFFFVGAVAGCVVNGNGQVQGEAHDNGNGNASGNGNGNGSGNGLDIGKSGTTGDGSWDITTGGGAAINPSEMVLVGSTANGYVALASEGKVDPRLSSCTRSTDRSEFKLTASGNTIQGSFTSVREWTGDGCPDSVRQTTIISGERTEPGKSDLDGTWNITAADDHTYSAVLRVAAADGIMSATSTRTEFSFAARKR
jgi:hypothetical protein